MDGPWCLGARLYGSHLEVCIAIAGNNLRTDQSWVSTLWERRGLSGAVGQTQLHYSQPAGKVLAMVAEMRTSYLETGNMKLF